jgi:hypothetical protein
MAFSDGVRIPLDNPELSEKAAMPGVKQGACHPGKWRKCMFLFECMLDALSAMFIHGANSLALHRVWVKHL